jgi:hypothetical protein
MPTDFKIRLRNWRRCEASPPTRGLRTLNYYLDRIKGSTSLKKAKELQQREHENLQRALVLHDLSPAS